MGIYLIVCPLVFLAGFVDSIAGGGGLISLPAYMFAGIPVHNAIATNKLSSSTGTVVSTARLIKNKKVDWGFVPGTVIGALIGSVAGANLALIISDHILKMVLVVILPIVAFCVLKDKNMDVEVPAGMTKNKQYLIAIVCSLVIGCYDGFYGPGTGTFLLLVFTKLAKIPLEKATGNVKIVNLSSNISALITFILAGKIMWGLGLAASCFSIAGHYVGAGMVVNNKKKVKIKNGVVKFANKGKYYITYKVTGTNKKTAKKTIKYVVKDHKVSLTMKNTTVKVKQNSTFNPLNYVASVKDYKGNALNIKNSVTVTGKVDTKKPGTYTLTYKAQYSNQAYTARTATLKVVVEAVAQQPTTKPVTTQPTTKVPETTTKAPETTTKTPETTTVPETTTSK